MSSANSRGLPFSRLLAVWFPKIVKVRLLSLALETHISKVVRAHVRIQLNRDFKRPGYYKFSGFVNK